MTSNHFCGSSLSNPSIAFTHRERYHFLACLLYTSNLEGTVAIASEGAESGRFKVVTSGYAKEGAITWQADQNGQGKYVYGNTLSLIHI